MKSGLIIIGVLLAAVALSDARRPLRPMACTRDWNPVCGVDNKTYSNACMARARGVPIASKGICRVCACPMIMKPVCGVNKVTYDNKCLAQCARVMFFPGPCSKYIPVNKAINNCHSIKCGETSVISICDENPFEIF